MPREQITISSYARLLDGLLDELGIDAAAVVGNSMGGFVSAELAIAFPQRVERLVLVSPAGLSTYANGAGRARWDAAPLRTGARRRARPGGPPTRTPSPAARAAQGDPERSWSAIPAGWEPRSRPSWCAAPASPGFMQALAANLDYDFRDRLPEIVCPTLIVWGDRDRVVTVRDAAVYAELIPGSRKVVFRDTGHLAMLERPDAFNALLRGVSGE